MCETRRSRWVWRNCKSFATSSESGDNDRCSTRLLRLGQWRSVLLKTLFHSKSIWPLHGE
ncbi:MAG: hypothetical protein DME24_11045 [Verrucomicrobia bacterium]|nr:MAG: hypothetical protein DME24_11045 [Verrucomicrobiota bacterium]